MSDERCKHGRVVFSRMCETFRCYDCEPLTHEQATELVDTLSGLVGNYDNSGWADESWWSSARDILRQVGVGS